MQSRVTALIVATNGTERLERTLEGLAQQTRKPDRVILVDNGSTDNTAAIFANVEAERIISTGEVLPFGAAIKMAVRLLSDDSTSDEWLWFLTHDSAPEPEALEAILATVQRAPSVAIAGPKLTSWDRPDHIREIGQTLTRFGARWQLSSEELDQEQRDTQQDTLAVGPVGMLIQRQLWEQMDGFDPALTIYDDGLDLCIRARLAGYRVVVAPGSRVRFAGDGVAGPTISRKMSVARRNYKYARAAQLHRRLAYAPAWAVPAHWLSLLPLALLRTFWYLLRELPGRIPGEISASFSVAFSGRKITDARRLLSSQKTVGWDAVRPLRIDNKSVRTQQMIDREAILARQGRVKRESHFISTGGLSLLMVSAVLSVALFYSFFSTTALSGAGLLPLSDTVRDLWANTSYGLHGIDAGIVGPSHPFNFVLAFLGTLTFWQPSFSLVLLYFAAIPLAGLGAWFWAARITERPIARGFISIAWMLSPTLLASLAQGRIGAVIVHILLPCLVMALMGARKSWSAAATSSIILAVVLACAPSLFPAVAVLFLVGLAFSGRGVARVLTIAIVPAALYFPLIAYAFAHGNLLLILIDPGVQVPFDAATPAQLLLGFPSAGLAGWNTALASIGAGTWPYTIIVAVLVAPLGLLALVGVALSKARRVAIGLLLAGVGLAGALIANQFVLSSAGSDSVGVWAGASVSIYWFGLLSLAIATLSALPKLSETVSVLSGLALTIAVVPVVIALFLGHGAFRSPEYTVPAVVRAAAQGGQNVGTLVLTPQPNGGVLGQVVRGTGAKLDQQSTLEFVSLKPTAREQERVKIIGGLLSEGAVSQLSELRRVGINFVVLSDVSEGRPIANDPVISGTTSRIQGALDGNSDVSAVGPTEFGDLWKVNGEVTASTPVKVPAVEQAYANTVWTIQLIAIAALFLLALPTGAVVERPPKPTRRKPSRFLKKETPVVPEEGIDQEEVPAADISALKNSKSKNKKDRKRGKVAIEQRGVENEAVENEVVQDVALHGGADEKKSGESNEFTASIVQDSGSRDLGAIPPEFVAPGGELPQQAKLQDPAVRADDSDETFEDAHLESPGVEGPHLIESSVDDEDIDDTVLGQKKTGEEPTDV